MPESREFTPEALREVAEILDELDELVVAYIDLCEKVGLGANLDMAQLRRDFQGTEVQDDVRRWADELGPLFDEVMTHQTGQTYGLAYDRGVESAMRWCVTQLENHDGVEVLVDLDRRLAEASAKRP